MECNCKYSSQTIRGCYVVIDREGFAFARVPTAKRWKLRRGSANENRRPLERARTLNTPKTFEIRVSTVGVQTA